MALQQYSLTKKWKGCVETKWKACPGTRHFKGQGGMIYTIIIAILGAVILTSIVRFFTRKSA